MDQEKLMRLVDKQKETLLELARSQAERAIGVTAVQMHAQGIDISTAALISALVSRKRDATALEQAMYEQAVQLLGGEIAPPASPAASTSL